MMHKKRGKTRLLLLEDITNLGRKGELVTTAKPGFVRNFLLPQKKAMIADKQTIRLQERLQAERVKQAEYDKKDAEELAARLKGKTFSIKVKHDMQGHLYGSVNAAGVAKFLEEQEGIKLEKKNVFLPKPFKMLGVYEVQLRLKEDVSTTFKLKIEGETKVQEIKSKIVEIIDEEKTEEEMEKHTKK